MTENERLYKAATESIKECANKHIQKIINCMYGEINHAYNAGWKDGKAEAYKWLEEETASAIDTAFQQGYDKGVAEKPSEIMKKYDEGCMEGQKKLLEALDVISESYDETVILSCIRNDTPEKIIKEAERVRNGGRLNEDDDNELKPGDEVRYINCAFPERYIVTMIHYQDGKIMMIGGISKSGKILYASYASVINYVKTGRHFDLDKVLGNMEDPANEL